MLSTLYQEKMVTLQEMEDLKHAAWPWSRLVVIQCTKPHNVVKRTAELLAEVGRDEQGKQLKSQCVVSVVMEGVGGMPSERLYRGFYTEI